MSVRPPHSKRSNPTFVNFLCASLKNAVLETQLHRCAMRPLELGSRGWWMWTRVIVLCADAGRGYSISRLVSRWIVRLVSFSDRRRGASCGMVLMLFDQGYLLVPVYDISVVLGWELKKFWKVTASVQ